MKIIYIFKIFAFSLFFFWASCSNKGGQQETQEITSEPRIFSLLTPEETGVNFINQLHDDVFSEKNVLSYDYYYNGAGVAIGDINNDGLPDIFFGGNEVPNKLYLNKGNLKFEDISEKAGINQGHHWCTGPVMADINGDGFLDIYVGQSGNNQDPKTRQNLLFINNGNLTFSEKGQEYGLNDGNQTTSASFFDYDKDGDLDCYVLNESKYARVIYQSVFEDLKNKASMLEASGNLFRNDGGKFTKVTEQAGVLRYGFGLGLATVDINNDGWTDIYVANDYSVPDFMFINNGDGTFTDKLKEYTRQISFYSMGVDIADYNNDAFADIAVVDMAADDHFRDKTLMTSMDVDGFWYFINDLKYQYAYMFNALQINNGNNTFSNIAALSGTLRTDWSWASLLADFDNDGWKDFFVTTGYRRYARDNDFRNEMQRLRDENGGVVPADKREEMYKKMPEIKLPNLLYKNNRDLTFANVSDPWGVSEPSYSNGGAYGDLDLDGDLDLVTNNIDHPAFIYRNNTRELKKGNFLQFALKGETPASALNAKVTLFQEGQVQFQEFSPVRGYEGCMEPILHFGVGQANSIEKVEIVWLDGRKQTLNNVPVNQRLIVNQKEANQKHDYSPLSAPVAIQPIQPASIGVDFIHRENQYNDFAREVLLPHRQSTLGPKIAVGDVNNDGLEDFFVGGAANQVAALYVQNKEGKFTYTRGPWELDVACEDMGAVFFDADGDGDQDLYVATGGGGEYPENSPALQDNLYINNQGTGNFFKVKALPEMLSSSTVVKAADFDKDGDMDLFVGGGAVPGRYPYPSRSYLLRNDNKKFTDVTQQLAPALLSPGIVKDFVWSDVNNDGFPDLAITGEWMPVSIFINEKGSFRDATKDFGLDTKKGWFYSIAEADVDGDGDKDFIVGNAGMNTKFRATEKKPFNVFASDFDKNGSCDIVLSKEYKGKLVPSRGRQCSSEQMPFIKTKFKTYKEFASAGMEDIFGKENLEKSLHLMVNDFHSGVLINNGGKFEFKNLPNEAQFAPVNRILLADLNNDKKTDLIIAGNMYETEVETPRYDAGNGLVLLGNGDGTFKPVNAVKSGFFAPKNVKDMQFVSLADGTRLIVVANNNDALQVFKLGDLRLLSFVN